MRDAVANQPVSVKPELFAPFIADVDAARRAPLLTRADLRGTSMAVAVDALLTERNGRWNAMLPLRAADRARSASSAAAAPMPRPRSTRRRSARPSRAPACAMRCSST
jgi:predicted exporter